MKNKAELKMVRGDDKSWTASFKDKTSGDPIDLTGATVTFTVKKDKNNLEQEAILSKEYDSIADPELGVMTFGVDHDEIEFSGSYDFDLQITSAGGSIVTPVIGKLLVQQDVSWDPTNE